MYAAAVAAPMLVLYALVVPGTILLTLRRSGSARLSDPSLMLRYGLLHSGYRNTKYWWELVVLVRKYAIIAVATFVQSDIRQLHFVLAVLIVALHLHDNQKPFGRN